MIFIFNKKIKNEHPNDPDDTPKLSVSFFIQLFKSLQETRILSNIL